LLQKKIKKTQKELIFFSLFWGFFFLLLVLPNNVVVEKVAVEERLHESRQPDNPLRVSGFREVAVNPIENVEGSVRPQTENVI
jgi:hypothetical protein